MPTILIIDDENAFRLKLRRVLEREGYKVIEAVNGHKGLACYRKNPADLVITDIIMPDQEGLETITELRRDFPTSKIVAISGGGRNQPGDYLDIAKALGANLVFCKPLDLDDFLKGIGDLLAM